MKGRLLGSRDSLSWIADEACELRRRGALRGKSWSLAQACEHLALAMQGTADSPPVDSPARGAPTWWRELGLLQRLKRRAIKHALLWSGRFPEGVPSPKVVLPSDGADLDHAIGMLVAAAEAFDRKRGRDDARWIAHPLLGPMSGAQWKRFHDLHARHHFRFMTDAGVSRAE